MFLFMLQLSLAKFCIFRYDIYMDATVYESNCASLWACTFLF